MKIAVVIPTYAPHVQFLANCLTSIRAQTRQPDHVVVVCSSATPEVEEAAAAIVTTAAAAPTTTFPVSLLFRQERQAAGKNRNDGADMIWEEMDVLSFFDSDDIMHPQRLKCVEAAFAAGADLFLHPCVMTADTNKEQPLYTLEDKGFFYEPEMTIHRDRIYTMTSDKPMDIWRASFVDATGPKAVANGHCSVRATLWKEIQFDPTHTGYEDTLFIAECVRRDVLTVVCREPLSLYVKDYAGGRVSTMAQSLSNMSS
jgi:glycosyltransferase involved in cell wall biosynthesis